ncbi:MAG: T9SS type A sorting domain-containing protein [Bacteroidia bacterium]|nr:T9SS type A sorting domain-containing protein [Bacteroidia bacterium]
MKKFFLILVFIIINYIGFSQTTYLMNNNTAVNLTCPSTSLFYDSGGAGGNYSNSETYVKTFNAPAGSCLQIMFSSFGTESCCDRLRIYDGPSGASPLIGTFVGTALPPTIVSSGTSLTFSWTTDGSIVNSGWVATINCLTACSGVPSPGVASSTSNFCGTTGTVNLSSVGATTGCGISYDWQTSSSPTGPWSNIPGAINVNAAVTFTATTYYRMRVQCNSANTVYTNTLMVTPATYTPSCALSTYTPSVIAYAPDVFAGTPTPSTDDVLYNNIALFGFNFCYGGASYWGGYVASNSSFVFDGIPCFPNILTTTYAAPGVGTGYTIPTAAPVNNTSIPRNAVLGPWHDANPSLGGTIAYATLGTAPNRRFVVKFENVPMYSCGTASPSIYFTGQIKLFETTNIIEIHVGNKGICPGWNGGYAVMGLHSYDGLTYVPPVNATAHNRPTQWTMTNTAYQFSSPCANGTGPCAVLPINFKNFYGERVDGINKLTWETALEENVKEFLVEQSNDADKFIPIGKVPAKNEPSEYKFDDKNAKPGTINYYRITSVEHNGERKSTFILPLGDLEADVAVSGVFPNPLKGDFSVSLNSRVMETVDVKVYDMFGKVVKQFNKPLNVGLQKLDFNLADVASGTYMLEISSPNRGILSQQKLIKVD